MQTDPETWDRRFKINRNRGIALLRSGNVSEARVVLEAVAAEQARRLGPENYQTMETRAFLAMALAASDDHVGALAQMRETVPALLDRWRDGAGDSVNQVGRTFRLKLIAEVYLSLLLDRSKGGDPGDGVRVAEAFQISDGVSTRGVQRALAQSTARSLAKDPATEELVRQRQDLEKQVAVLRSRLNDAYGSKEAATPEVLGALRGQIGQAEAALRGLEQEVARVFPEYAALTNPKPVSLAEARESLEPGEALVLTFAGEDQLFVWAVPKEGDALAHVAALGRTDLKDRVDALHAALAPNVQTLGDIPAYDVAGGYELYRQLLEPVSPAWKDERRLLVIADGPLGTLPFAVLPTADVALAPDDATLFDGYRQVPWLARSHALAQLPSVASLINLRQTQVSQENRFAFVGFGDPWFDRDAEQVAAADTRGVMRGVSATEQPIQLRNLPQTRAADSATLASLPRLPDTADEILAVAETLRANLDRDVYIGLEASERRVKDLNDSGELKKYRTLSFATHGLVPGDLDGLVKPALAMAAPTLEEAEQGDDGLLTSDEILGLRLDADWAVLSACNTAAADGAGAEAVSGLGRAFFYAGAKAILVSNWPVHSDATRSLMTELFASYAASGNRGRAEALQTAMQHMIDGEGFEVDGERIFSYAHPIFWAPFVVVGNGG
jgi:CHAT domain-containing protein